MDNGPQEQPTGTASLTEQSRDAKLAPYTRSRKRKRQTCVPCRREKAKCDEQKPCCGTCIDCDIPCQYNHQRETHNKRLRTLGACDICRLKKSICDEQRPTCSHCVDVGFVCRYQWLKKPMLEEKPKGTEMGEVGLIAGNKGVRQWKL